jgi:O-antigen ligase
MESIRIDDIEKNAPGRLWLLPIAAGIVFGAFFAGIGNAFSPSLILIFAGSTAVVMLSMFSPAIAFLFVALVVPIERLGRFFEDSAVNMISLMRLAGLLALLSYSVHAIIKRWRPRISCSLLLYGGYCLVAGITLIYSEDLSQSLRIFGLIIGNLIFFLLTTNVVRSWKLARMALKAWILTSVFIGIFTIWSWSFGGSIMQESEVGMQGTRFSTTYEDNSEWESLRNVARAVGPTSSPAVYGINMILTLPFLICLIRMANSPMAKGLWAISLAIVLYNLILTNTRATIVGGIAALVLSGIYGLFSISRARLVAFLLILLLFIPMVPSEVFRRALSPANYTLGQSATLRARLTFWEAWTHAVRDHWLTGVGIGDEQTLNRYINRSDIPATVSVHNEFLATFLELGIVGWLLFLGFLGSILWTTRKALRHFREVQDDPAVLWFLAACQVSYIVVLLYGIQCDVFHLPLKGWWLIAGLSHGIYLESKARRVPGPLMHQEVFAQTQIGVPAKC